jgi:very-short-patch-repair endonuclease
MRKIISYNPKLTQLARQLRKNSTSSEIRLWNALRNKQMLGFDFHRQKPIGNYIIDLFCNELMLAIELDGLTHSFPEVYERDLVKEASLKEIGITLLRFNDSKVMNDLPNVIRTIETTIEEIKSRS